MRTTKLILGLALTLSSLSSYATEHNIIQCSQSNESIDTLRVYQTDNGYAFTASRCPKHSLPFTLCEDVGYVISGPIEKMESSTNQDRNFTNGSIKTVRGCGNSQFFSDVEHGVQMSFMPQNCTFQSSEDEE